MNRFDLILQLRRTTKRIVVLRKIIDFVPIFSQYDRYLYKYARVRLEEQKIKRLLSENEPKLNLICDLKCTPPSYGDYVEFLMAARILSTRFKVTLIIVINDLRSDWKDLKGHEQQNRINDFNALAQLALLNCGAELKVVESFSEVSNLIMGSQTVLFDFVCKRKPIYWDLKFLNKRLYRSLGCEPKVLLDQIKFSDLKSIPNFRYVLWHIRTESIWNRDQDMSSDGIIYNYMLLRRVLGSEIRIIVCGNEKGLQRVMDLSSHYNLNLTSARKYSDSFIGDLELLGKCEFFLQVGGGGFTEYAWNSSVPFLVVSFPWKPRDFRIFRKIQGSKRQITAWQTTNQVFRLKSCKSEGNFESELKKFCHDLDLGS
jgi:hypothetical protein